MTRFFTQFKEVAPTMASCLKVLSHPNRLLLLAAIGDKEQSVSELEVTTGIKQPLLSRELSKLRDEKLVETRRDGKSIYYTLAEGKSLPLLQALSDACSQQGSPKTGQPLTKDPASPPLTATQRSRPRLTLNPYRLDR